MCVDAEIGHVLDVATTLMDAQTAVPQAHVLDVFGGRTPVSISRSVMSATIIDNTSIAVFARE